jgi:hypothetical protein
MTRLAATQASSEQRGRQRQRQEEHETGDRPGGVEVGGDLRAQYHVGDDRHGKVRDQQRGVQSVMACGIDVQAMQHARNGDQPAHRNVIAAHQHNRDHHQ